MARTIARNQITIVDLNDAKQVHAYLQASLGDAQVYNPDTKVYTPNYPSTNNVIEPRVYETGNPNNLIASCTDYTYSVNGTEIKAGSSNGSFQVTAGGKLTIASNIDKNALVIQFSCNFKDAETKQTTKVEAYKTITKSTSAGALFQAVIECPKGNVFDKSTAGDDLTAVCKTFRGSTPDNTDVNFSWEQLDVTKGQWTDVASGRSNGETLTVKPEDVLNFQTFRCTAKDIGGQDAAAKAVALVTFEDKTDPYELEVISNTGDKIMNGQGETILKARVWQSGNQIETEETPEGSRKFTYTWTKYNKDGEKDGDTQTGNPLTVPASQIDRKATFICELSKK